MVEVSNEIGGEKNNFEKYSLTLKNQLNDLRTIIDSITMIKNCRINFAKQLDFGETINFIKQAPNSFKILEKVLIQEELEKIQRENIDYTILLFENMKNITFLIENYRLLTKFNLIQTKNVYKLRIDILKLSTILNTLTFEGITITPINSQSFFFNNCKKMLANEQFSANFQLKLLEVFKLKNKNNEKNFKKILKSNPENTAKMMFTHIKIEQIFPLLIFGFSKIKSFSEFLYSINLLPSSLISHSSHTEIMINILQRFILDSIYYDNYIDLSTTPYTNKLIEFMSNENPENPFPKLIGLCRLIISPEKEKNNEIKYIPELKIYRVFKKELISPEYLLICKNTFFQHNEVCTQYHENLENIKEEIFKIKEELYQKISAINNNFKIFWNRVNKQIQKNAHQIVLLEREKVLNFLSNYLNRLKENLHISYNEYKKIKEISYLLV